MYNWRNVIRTIEDLIPFGTIGNCSLHGVCRGSTPQVIGSIHIETESGVYWGLAIWRMFYAAVDQDQYQEWTITLAVSGRVYQWIKFDYDNVDCAVDLVTEA